MEEVIKLRQQLKEVEKKYYALWNDIEEMHTKLRMHLSTVVAAFLGIIASLHTYTNNARIEWLFFVCIVLCILSLICLLVSAYEDLHNMIALRDRIKVAYDNAIDKMAPIDKQSFTTPRKKVYSILFWVGIIIFGIAILIYCVINMPIW